ncbi:putative zinc finger mynd-type protein [Rosellinia necatrix]|uniref:Putative zinc finger mynd-type protein n=1 Tax=Rosellinia necatrix TaxID=77044 RepID=A0A1W2TSV9_ROSNE|nr:putative zinc finger mynd-type protein [Rosellinia necatrix]
METQPGLMATQTHEEGVRCSNATEGHAAHVFDPVDGQEDQNVLGCCTVCDSAAGMRCPSCGTAYCNKICFAKDWPHHKALCKPLKEEFSHSKAPKNHVRAIIFAVDSIKPAWIWLDLKALDIAIVRALGITIRRPFSKAVSKLEITDINKGFTARKIGHGIRQFIAPNVRDGGQNINKSIFALADPGSLKTYFGAVIFLSFRTIETDGAPKVYYTNATPRDLRMIIEWFLTRHENPCVSARNRLPIKSYGKPGERASLWPAVRINCDGDIPRLSSLAGKVIDQIQNVQVLVQDTFNRRYECELANKVGLPWVVQLCYGTYDPISHQGNLSYITNLAGRFFAPKIPDYFERWGITSSMSPLRFQREVQNIPCGSLLIIHKYGCQIDKAHVAALVKFFNACLIIEGDPLEVITRENFESFWLQWVDEAMGALKAIFPSPYNTNSAAETDPVPLTEEEIEEARKKVTDLLLEKAEDALD